MTPAPRIAPQALKRRLGDGAEIALLDVRELGVFYRGHLLLAASLPLSQLELRIDALVPRRATPIVLIDDGDGLAERTAARLARFGYGALAVLEGGNPAWKAAGYELFGGVNVPSKAFGEAVEHAKATPRLSAAELAQRRERGERIAVLDSRPFDEFRRMNIPGAIDCPGAELVLRVHDLVPDAETTVVVNCAGRTRSIIGAQSLIDAGIPNPVFALENGTMGWHLAGLALEKGATRRAPHPGPVGLARAREAAARVAERAGVAAVDAATLARWRADPARTLYVFDVRSPEEFAIGHLAGARSAPGGQLVQATDQYAAVRNARLVLIDGDGVRAPMTAAWLRQMGWADVAVLAADGAGLEAASGPEAANVLGLSDAAAQGIVAPALETAMRLGDVVVVDLASSPEYRQGHIPGAWYAIRARLGVDLAKVPPAPKLVLTSPDGVLARLAAAEATETLKRPVLVLQGGTGAWAAAGLPLEAGEGHQASAPEDVWPRPNEQTKNVEDAMREYLRWETALVDQIARDGDLRFAIAPSR